MVVGAPLVRMGQHPPGLSVPLPPLSSPAPQNPEDACVRACVVRFSCSGYHRTNIELGHLYSTVCLILISIVLGMARVNDGSHSFSCHSHVSISLMCHVCLCFLAAEHYHILASTYFLFPLRVGCCPLQ